jgi:hypothetical protein
MDNLQTQKTMSADSVFGNRFLNSKSFYLYCFNALPTVHFIGNMAGEKAYTAFKENTAPSCGRSTRYAATTKSASATSSGCLVVFDEGWCELLHDGKDTPWLHEFTTLMARFKVRERRKPLEINLIVQQNYGLDLRSMEINAPVST